MFLPVKCQECGFYGNVKYNLNQTNIEPLKEIFIAKEFVDNSVIFVYDYHPGSQTPLNKHFSPVQPSYCNALSIIILLQGHIVIR